MLQLTFNPGLTLTGFGTTRPWLTGPADLLNFYIQKGPCPVITTTAYNNNYSNFPLFVNTITVEPW